MVQFDSLHGYQVLSSLDGPSFGALSRDQELLSSFFVTHFTTIVVGVVRQFLRIIRRHFDLAQAIDTLH